MKKSTNVLPWALAFKEGAAHADIEALIQGHTEDSEAFSLRMSSPEASFLIKSAYHDMTHQESAGLGTKERGGGASGFPMVTVVVSQ